MSTPKIPAFRAQATIRNLGAIREAHLDLRPLTVLFGHNGVNKTWAAYSIVGAMQQALSLPDCLHGDDAEVVKRSIAELDAAEEHLAEVAIRAMMHHDLGLRALGEIRISPNLDLSSLERVARRAGRRQLAGNQLARYLAVPNSLASDAETIVGQAATPAVVEDLARGRVDLVLELSSKFSLRTREGDRLGQSETGRTSRRYVDPWWLALRNVDSGTVRDVCQWLLSQRDRPEPIPVLFDSAFGPNRNQSRRESILTFPADRKALSALYRELEALSDLRTEVRRSFRQASGAQAELGFESAMRDNTVQNALDDKSSFPEPVRSYLRWLGGIQSRSASLPNERRSHQAERIAELADVLQSIIGGRMMHQQSTKSAALGYRNGPLVFRFGEDRELPFQAAASLARSLGLLDIWLREEAEPGDLVLIDEPEMNAHPETQVKIAELLAMLVNAGLRVIITTHSPYLVEHLEGLMLGSRLEPEAREHFVSHLALKDHAAWLDPEDLAVYHFVEQPDGEVKVEDALDREACAIDWRTFSQPRDRIGNLVSAMLATQGTKGSEGN